MNKIQQEMKLFHDKIEPILEKILEQYNKKNTKKTYNTITKPCKKLIQKCSYRSISDTSSLCSLAYWLYIYGDKDTLGHAMGKEFRASLAILDQGFAGSIKKLPMK